MKITDAVSLGNAIRLRRKELKYTQSYISEVTALIVSFVAKTSVIFQLNEVFVYTILLQKW